MALSKISQKRFRGCFKEERVCKPYTLDFLYVNHLWWSAATCNGDPHLCQEKWKSIVTKNGSNTSQTHETACTDKGGKTACQSTSAKTVNMTQLSDISQSLLSMAFAGLTESMKTGFADLGKLTKDMKITADKEISSVI